MPIQRTMYRHGRRAAGLVATLTCSLAVAEAAPPPGAPGTITLERGTTTDAGAAVSYELGTLHVPENRAAPNSRTIGVGFGRLRARTRTGAPPIVFLPGGPGSSYLDAFTGDSANAKRRLAMFRAYAQVADVIVLDQRGFSQRGDVLAVPTPPPRPLDRPNTVAAESAAWIALARAAPAANPGRDLSGYSIAQCAADVDDLRRALGYPQISLLGGSFGSQWSFAVIATYPASVARAVLTGVEPLDAGFDVPSQTFAALQRIAFEADRAPALQPYLPADGSGVMGAVRALRERFAKAPVTVRTTDAAGAPVSVVLGPEDLQAAMYPDDPATWPAFVLSLYHGHYDAWAKLEVASRRRAPFSSLINALIDSGLGGSAARLHQLRTDPALAWLGTWGYETHTRSRSAWPTPDAGDAFRTPVASQIPVVLVAGDWDTSTPVENALDIQRFFPRGRTLLVRHGEHATASYLTSRHPKAFAGLLAFLRTGDASGVPPEISFPVPSFEVPAFPPPAQAAKAATR